MTAVTLHYTQHDVQNIALIRRNVAVTPTHRQGALLHLDPRQMSGYAIKLLLYITLSLKMSKHKNKNNEQTCTFSRTHLKYPYLWSNYNTNIKFFLRTVNETKNTVAQAVCTQQLSITLKYTFHSFFYNRVIMKPTG